MISFKKNTIFLVIVPYIFLLCSTSPIEIVGGSASEGEAKAVVYGRVVDDSGNPVAGKYVVLSNVLITSDSANSIFNRTEVTDIEGEYIFEDVPEGTYILFCSDTFGVKSALCSRLVVSADRPAENRQLILGSPKTLIGRIIAEVGVDVSRVSVFIPGFDGYSGVSADGMYSLSGVPQGVFEIAFIYDNIINYLPISVKNVADDTIYIWDVSLALDIASADNEYSFYNNNLDKAYTILFIPYGGSEPLWYMGKDFLNARYYRVLDSGVLVEVDSDRHRTLLIDDFEDGDALSFIGSINMNSIWYAFTDIDNGGNSIMLPEGIVDDFALGFSNIDAYKGTSFQASCILGDASALSYAGIGCTMAKEDGSFADMTQLTSVRFFLKGRGGLRLMFWSKSGVDGYSENQLWGQLGYDIVCDSYWNRITINVTDIKPAPSSQQEADSLTWESAREFIERIELRAVGDPGDTIEFIIDDFYLNGLTEDLIYQ